MSNKLETLQPIFKVRDTLRNACDEIDNATLLFAMGAINRAELLAWMDDLGALEMVAAQRLRDKMDEAARIKICPAGESNDVSLQASSQKTKP